jgi:23S rRNA pseudouridine1911/1915/1917 synthase
VLERFGSATFIECQLETGRTHQIRIHLAEAGYPLLGERVYAKRYAGSMIPAPRLMLHAFELGFVHPKSGAALHFEEPIPADMLSMLAGLRSGSAASVVSAGEKPSTSRPRNSAR